MWVFLIVISCHMIVMRSKQAGVEPRDIRGDTVVCSFCSTPWQSNTKFFPLESRINFIRPPPRFLAQL